MYPCLMQRRLEGMPRLWFHELSLITACGFTARIAGGCLRDHDNQRPVKDVDIFVNYAPDLRVLSESFGWTCNPAANYGDIADVAGLWTYVKDGVEFNVIMLDRALSVDELAQRMDFGLCQIVAVDADHVLVTPQYLADLEVRTFTQLDPLRTTRSLRRWERLKLKYPEWELVIPA